MLNTLISTRKAYQSDVLFGHSAFYFRFVFHSSTIMAKRGGHQFSVSEAMKLLFAEDSKSENGKCFLTLHIP